MSFTRCSTCPRVFRLTVIHEDGEHGCTSAPIKTRAAGHVVEHLEGDDTRIMDLTNDDNVLNEDDDSDMDTSEHNNVSGTDSPLGTTPTSNSAPTSDCESELIRPTRTTSRQIIESESSASGGENDDEDTVVLSDGCVTQEARLVGRQTGGAGAAIRFPSSTSQEFRYELMALREKREVEPTEQLPVEYSNDYGLIMTALGSVEYSLRIYTIRTSKPLSCGYEIYYRHTRQSDPGEEWYYGVRRRLTLQQIERRVGKYCITHMSIWEDVPPDIHILLPHLTHLCLFDLTEKDSSHLEWIGALTDLQELHVDRSHYLLTLPDSIGKLHKLRRLDLSENARLQSLPDRIGELTDLQELCVRSCNSLMTLPDSIGKLHKLRRLVLSGNIRLKSLPDSIGNLQELTRLDLSLNIPWRLAELHLELKIPDNRRLESLPESVCNLRSLTELNVFGRESLRSPPLEVCEIGIESIRQYFKDLAAGREKITPAVTVAVIGQTMAGKTSLIKTLQSEAKERVLTYRGPDATLDESTKVFNVQQVKADDALLRFIDVGGQDVYHSTYQLTFRNSCIPLVVANIEHFGEMRRVQGINALEAVRLLCFDWLAQIYVACPKLGPPKLVFTHLDKVSQNRFEELTAEFLNTCQILKKAVMEESKLVTDGDQVSLINHFVKEENVFLPKDIFSVGKSTDYSVFEEIIESLRIDCMALSKEIPSIWKTISDTLDSCGGAVVNMSDLLAKLRHCDVEKRQLEVVLTYLVDCGKVLWYPNIDNIQENIFHSIEKVTSLIGILFAHDDSKCWSERIENFKPVISSTGLIIEPEQFQSMYDQYKESGVISEEILSYLIKNESDFREDHELKIALSLLGHFRLIFGPVDHKGQPGFILPHFTSGYQSASLATADNEMCLHADMALKGMTVPRHVYYQMSIGVMQLFPRSTDNVVLSRNGLIAYKDGISLCLTHDFKSKSVAIEVAGRPCTVDQMWAMAISVIDSAAQHLKTSWRAARHIISFPCAHCLLVGNQHPAKVINPRWIQDQTLRVEPMLATMCKSYSGVPACLNHPCKALSRENIAGLEEYIKDHKSKSGAEYVQCTDGSDSEESITLSTRDRHVAQIPQAPSGVEPTLDFDTQSLFNNTDKVFKMTCPIRGRALIINMENFTGTNGGSLKRKGSDKDVREMREMLEAFKFEVEISQDRSAEDIITDIVTETQNADHREYGMFFLCIMSHGQDHGTIMGSDQNGVKLTEICDTLSPTLFPAMAGKPKVIVIQACGGTRVDEGALVYDTPSGPEDLGTRPKTAATRSSTATDNQAMPVRVLNVDDLFILRSSFDSYVSFRHEQHGALFIRSLIKTFYEHACNKDMHSLYKMIQELVREESMKLTGQQLDQCSGQTVMAIGYTELSA